MLWFEIWSRSRFGSWSLKIHLPIQPYQLHPSTHIYLSNHETKTYPGSKAFLRIEISKWSLMGRHHLVLLSHPEFHKAQCLDLSCSWYTSMTCPQEFPPQYDFLLMIVYCTESYETNRMQHHYRQILIIYRNGKENGKWFSTRRSYRLPTIFTDRP